MGTPENNDELTRDAPHLAGLPKADPFRVPDGFFERFPHAVQAAITTPHPASPAWPWWKRVAIALPVVAVAGLASWFLLTRDTEAPQAVAITPLTDLELEALDDAEILAALDDAEADELHLEDLGAVALQLNDEELLAFLEEEDADIDDLITDIE